MGGTAGTKTPRLNHASIQTSAYGVAITRGWGTFRTSVNLIWMGPLASKSVKQSGGGKGGSQPKTYDYSASVLMAACSGPITAISEVFKDQSRFVDGSLHSRLTTIATALTAAGNAAMAADYTTLASQAAALNSGSKTALQQAGLSLAVGNTGQAAQSFLSGNQALGYSRTAYVYAQNYPLSGNATLPNHTLAVTSTTRATVGSTTLDDAQPADILPSFLSIVPSWPTGILGDLTEYRAACQAYSFFLSPVLDSQKTASQFLDDLMDASNAAGFWSEGLLKVRPYSDTARTANGATFTPDLTPIYSLTDNDYLKSSSGDPVRIELKAPADAYNYVQVEYSDRTHQYNTAIMPAADQASIEQFGLRKEDPVSMRMVTLPSVATVLAQVRLQRTCNVRQTFYFGLPASYCLLEQMDLVELTDTRLGLDRKLVRITDIDEDPSGELFFTAEEMLVGASSPPLISRQGPLAVVSNYDVAPGDVNAPVLFNPPSSITTGGGMEAWVAVSGGANWGGAEVWISFDGTNYERQGIISGGAKYGVLTASLAIGTDPDTTHTLKVDLSASGSGLLSTSETGADAAGTLCRVGSELVSYKTATLTGSNTYDLTYLRRGVNQTAISAHASGSDFIRLDDSIYKFPYTEAQKGQTLYVKFLSFNIFGRSVQALADVDPYTFVLDPDVITVPAPGALAWTLTAASSEQSGKTGLSLLITGAVDYTLADSIVLKYRGVGAPEWIDGGTYARDVVKMSIDGLIEGALYEVAVSYRVGDTYGPPLVLTNATASRQPLVFNDVKDGDTLVFDPALSGPPTFTVDRSGCIAAGSGEVEITRFPVTATGGTIELKLSSSGGASNVTRAITGTGVGMTPPHAPPFFDTALKPTVADAYDGNYTFSFTATPQSPPASGPTPPLYLVANVWARASGSSDWVQIGQVSRSWPNGSYAPGSYTATKTIYYAGALGSDGAAQFGLQVIFGGSPSAFFGSYVTQTASGETSATDSTHSAVVTIFPPGYAESTNSAPFNAAAVAALPEETDTSTTPKVAALVGGVLKGLPLAMFTSPKFENFDEVVSLRDTDFIPALIEASGLEKKIALKHLIKNFGFIDTRQPPYDVKGDTQDYRLAHATAGSPYIGAGDPIFEQKDQGKRVMVSNVGTAGGNVLYGWLDYVDAYTIRVMTAQTGGTAMNAYFTRSSLQVVWGTDDTAGLVQAVLDAEPKNLFTVGQTVGLMGTCLTGDLRIGQISMFGMSPTGSGFAQRPEAGGSNAWIADRQDGMYTTYSPRYYSLQNLVFRGNRFVQNFSSFKRLLHIRGGLFADFIGGAPYSHLENLDFWESVWDGYYYRGAAGSRAFGLRAFNNAQIGIRDESQDVNAFGWHAEGNGRVGILLAGAGGNLTTVKCSFNGGNAPSGSYTQELGANMLIVGSSYSLTNLRLQESWGANLMISNTDPLSSVNNKGARNEIFKLALDDTADVGPKFDKNLANLPSVRPMIHLKGNTCVDNAIEVVKGSHGIYPTNFATHALYETGPTSRNTIEMRTVGPTNNPADWYNGGLSDNGVTIPGGSGATAPGPWGTNQGTTIVSRNPDILINGVQAT